MTGPPDRVWALDLATSTLTVVAREDLDAGWLPVRAFEPDRDRERVIAYAPGRRLR